MEDSKGTEQQFKTTGWYYLIQNILKINYFASFFFHHTNPIH